jgi:hypothetical protein
MSVLLPLCVIARSDMSRDGHAGPALFDDKRVMHSALAARSRVEKTQADTTAG